MCSKASPTERVPEWQITEDAERYVEKQKDRRIPHDVCAEDELRLVEQVAFEFFSRHGLPRPVIKKQGGLHDDETRTGEEQEKDQMRPGPGDTKVLRDRGVLAVATGRGQRCCVGDGISVEYRVRGLDGARVFGRGGVRIRLGGIVRRIVENGHRLLPRADLRA